MSKDEKAGAAAAQLLIDDEPDDWYVGPLPLKSGKQELTPPQGQENLQHGVRRYVGRRLVSPRKKTLN
jgi:hypothetical protein